MNAQPRPPVVAQVSRRFAVPAERVFDAWLDPQQAGKWLFATPTGEMVKVEIDPRIGGHYCFTDRRDGVDVEHRGEYLVIDRPRRLVFTLSVEQYGPGVDRITVDIVPLASGCDVTVSHEMSAEYAEYRTRTEQDWAVILEEMAEGLGDE